MADLGGRHRDRRRDDGVDTGEELVEGVDESAPAALGVQVFRCPDEAALIEERAHVITEVASSFAQPFLVHRRGLGKQDEPADFVELFDVGNLDRDQLGAEVFECRNGFARGRFDVGVQVVEVEVFGDAEFSAGERGFRSQAWFDHGLIGTAFIARVCARHGAVDFRGVANGAAEGAGVIEGVAEREDAVAADSSKGGLEADEAAEGRGDADRAAGIRTEGEAAESSGEGGGRAAARAAGNAVRVPRIANGAVVRIVARDAVGPFMQTGLADHHGSGGGQLLDDGAVEIGDEVVHDLRTDGGLDALGVEEIFGGVRNAVELAAVVARLDFLLGLPRLCEGVFGGDGDEGVQAGLPFFDEVQQVLSEFDGGEFASLDSGSEIRDGEIHGLIHYVRSAAGRAERRDRIGAAQVPVEGARGLVHELFHDGSDGVQLFGGNVEPPCFGGLFDGHGHAGLPLWRAYSLQCW